MLKGETWSFMWSTDTQMFAVVLLDLGGSRCPPAKHLNQPNEDTETRAEVVLTPPEGKRLPVEGGQLTQHLLHGTRASCFHTFKWIS